MTIKRNTNPILRADYPDPDVIRVDDTYYMVSTTMHFMPGGIILRSYDLLHWEIVTHIYEKLDSTPGQTLSGKNHIYGKGMWAPSFRYHKGTFYVCFAGNDTGKTYLYTAAQIEGPWKKQYIEGFYHDASLLFEEDRVYIVYGNTEIHLTELTADLKGPKEGGLDRIIVKEEGEAALGFEGSHIYKIHGKYYVFFIHSPGRAWFRTQACYRADSLEGEFTGKDVLRDDMNYCGQGVAQGGIVDTPEGEWYGILFQDRGAVGRIPVVVPVTWENDFPVFGKNGKVPEEPAIKSTRPDYEYEPLFSSDDFSVSSCGKGKASLKKVWEFNHEPDHNLWSLTERPKAFRIRSGKICESLEEAVNTLTQRLLFPGCEITVTVDGSALKEGDYAGLCALQGCFGFIAMTCTAEGKYLVMAGREAEDQSLMGKKEWNAGKEYARIPVCENTAVLKMKVDFQQMKDEAEFFYQEGGEWKKLGWSQKLYFKMDHFTGCRAGLFLYSALQTGGAADFMDFRYDAADKLQEV